MFAAAYHKVCSKYLYVYQIIVAVEQFVHLTGIFLFDNFSFINNQLSINIGINSKIHILS